MWPMAGATAWLSSVTGVHSSLSLESILYCFGFASLAVCGSQPDAGTGLVSTSTLVQ